jgi:hypothetical protein
MGSHISSQHLSGMAELMIKTIKHSIIVLFGFLEYVKSWDLQLQEVLCGYKCGMQVSTKFSPLWSLWAADLDLRWTII